jgi:hypothetical protein
MGFTKNDPRINRKGRLPASVHIAATFKDISADFPDLAPSERKLLHVAATLLFRGESCKDNAVAHRCCGEARKILAGLRRSRAVTAVAKAPKLSGLPSVAELIISRDEEKQRASSRAKGSAARSVRQPA